MCINKVYCKIIAVLFVCLVGMFNAAYADEDSSALQEDIARLKLEIEKLKLEEGIATTKNSMAKASTLSEAETAKALAESQKAKSDADKAAAEADLAALNAKIPPTSIVSLAGTVDTEHLGSYGSIVAVKLADEFAFDLCGQLPDSKKVFIFDTTALSGVMAASQFNLRALQVTDTLDKALKLLPTSGTGSDSQPEGAIEDILVGRGMLKSVAELFSVFKTNIVTVSTSLDESKAVFLASLGHHCIDKITTTSSSYLGELHGRQMEQLEKTIEGIFSRTVRLAIRLNRLKKAMEGNAKLAKANEKLYEDIATVLSAAEKFIKALSPEDDKTPSPLMNAIKYLAYAELIKDSYALDVTPKIETLVIKKSNIFTGESLRLSAFGLVTFQLYEQSGALLQAGVLAHMTKPVKLKLRAQQKGDDLFDKFTPKVK